MNILTLDNKTLDLSKIPNDLEEEIRFSILDNSDMDNPDFYFQPLLFLETFNAPAIVLNIDGHELKMPLDWSIAIGDDNGTEVEIISLTSLNDRGFEAFLYNPLSSFIHSYASVEITNIYNEVKWYAPRLKPNQLVAVPLSNSSKPICAYFIKDYSKQNDIINHFKLL